MSRRTVFWALIFSMLAVNSGFGQQAASKRESRKFRTILTLGGAGGGFTLGVFLGIAAFDDAVNSDRKVWMTAILAGAAGGVGGYFLGRALDKRAAKTSWRYSPDPLYPYPALGRWPDESTQLDSIKLIQLRPRIARIDDLLDGMTPMGGGVIASPASGGYF